MPRGRPSQNPPNGEPPNKVVKRGRGRPRKTSQPPVANGIDDSETKQTNKDTSTRSPGSNTDVKPVWTSANNESTTAHMTHARKHVNYLIRNSPIYTHLLSNAEVVAASATHVITSLDLKPHHLNSMGSLHGSVTATFVDFIGGVVIACSDLREYTGVSTDIHVSYCGKATTGDTIEIEGVAEKVGGTLAFTRVVVRTVPVEAGAEGRLVAMGRHTKFVQRR